MRKPNLLLQALLFVYTVCCILDNNNCHCLETGDEPIFKGSKCSEEPHLTPNSTYNDNLSALLAILVSQANTSLTGFYKTSAGTEPTEIAYGLFLCRGDLSVETCSNCVFTATKEVPKQCTSMEGTFMFDQCMICHSYQKNFSALDQSENIIYGNKRNVTDPDRLEQVLDHTLNDLANRASSGGSDKKFAVGEAEYSVAEKLYGLAQCTPDLTHDDCNYCLGDCISVFQKFYASARGARVMFRSCSMRYELYQFYNTTADVPPLALQPLPPPTAERKVGISKLVVVAIVVAVCVSVGLFIAVGFCLLTKAAKKEDSSKNAAGNAITMEHSLQYYLGTIQAATNNFLPENKIGQGGYGPVYKGILSNGQEIAVKRLSMNSGQGAAEFRNEVVVVAKLQHGNLVRLLGFCLEAEEKILIYEFVPNKSLDYLIFGLANLQTNSIFMKIPALESFTAILKLPTFC